MKNSKITIGDENISIGSFTSCRVYNILHGQRGLLAPKKTMRWRSGQVWVDNLPINNRYGGRWVIPT